MNSDIFTLTGNKFKSTLLHNEELLISSKEHRKIDSFPKNEKEKKLLEDLKIIPIHKITKMSFNERSVFFSIGFEKKMKSKKIKLQFKKQNERINLSSSIAEINGLKKGVEAENKLIALLKNLGIFVVFTFLFGLFYKAALNLEQGIHFEITGRRAGIKKIFGEILKTLGSQGVLILSLIALAIGIYVIIKNYKNPANVITYQ